MADVEKKEDKAEGEEEEELDCSVPEVVNKYQFAGGVANGEPPASGLGCPLGMLAVQQVQEHVAGSNAPLRPQKLFRGPSPSSQRDPAFSLSGGRYFHFYYGRGAWPVWRLDFQFRGSLCCESREFIGPWSRHGSHRVAAAAWLCSAFDQMGC